MKRRNSLKIPVIQGVVLGVSVYRGYASIADLASISKADVYDQVSNPLGTQRDLSGKHAREAYQYVKEKKFAFWPEVFLCERKKKVVTFVPLKAGSSFGELHIDLDVAQKERVIAISRVDGNHRLNYADGKNPKYPAIHKTVSFCMAYNLTREQEISLFRDINDNQKRMNTNHLAKVQVRLTPEEKLKQKDPVLYIAHKLGDDPKSPLYNRINYGSKKSEDLDIPLGTLRTGIEYMLSRTKELQLHDADGQYKEIRNYFTAVKKWQPNAWVKSKEYLMMRGVGLWAICFIGAYVIDRVLLAQKFSADDMLAILASSKKKWNWSTTGQFKGFSGRGGAVQITKKVVKTFADPNRQSSSDLYQRILDQD
jgi:DGQHR domain-containing protein